MKVNDGWKTRDLNSTPEPLGSRALKTQQTMVYYDSCSYDLIVYICVFRIH